MKRLLLLILVLFSVILLTEQPLRADGCFIPPPAFEVPPPIPAQRAVIAWDGKTETLLVESSLNAKGQSFGWIIPLPNVPTVVEKGTPDIINTLDLCCRPWLVSSSFNRWLGMHGLLILVFLFVPAFFVGRIIKRNQGPTVEDLVAFGGLLFVVLFLLAGLLPASSNVSPAGMQPSIRLQAVVGNYEISVLDCKKAEELEAWLASNGFAKLPPSGKPIVEDYIKRKWCFVASKLQMEGDGPRAPHPLLFKFPVTAPVYPMKLTALANSPVYLKLFVIAPRRAEIPGLRTDFVSRLENLHIKDQEIPVELAGWLKPENHIVTAATDIVKPSAMGSDMDIGFCGDEEYHQRTCYTHSAAWQEGINYACIVLFFGMLLILLGYPFYGFWLVVKFKGPRRFCLMALTLLALLAVFVTIVTYLCLPKVASAHVITNPFTEVELFGQAFGDLKKSLKGNDLTKETISKLYWEKLRKISSDHHHPLVNPYTGEPIKEEVSPGNFSIEMTSKGPVVHYCRLHRFGRRFIYDTWPLYKENKK
jgi:hypothetical protein